MFQTPHLCNSFRTDSVFQVYLNPDLYSQVIVLWLYEIGITNLKSLGSATDLHWLTHRAKARLYVQIPWLLEYATILFLSKCTLLTLRNWSFVTKHFTSCKEHNWAITPSHSQWPCIESMLSENITVSWNWNLSWLF